MDGLYSDCHPHNKRRVQMAKIAKAKQGPKCAVTEEQFMGSAKPAILKLDLGGGEQQLYAGTKKFNSGSFGWYAPGKLLAVVDGIPVQVQVGLVLTVIGSKHLAPTGS